MNTYFFLLRVFLTGTSSSASSAFRLTALAVDLLKIKMTVSLAENNSA